MLAGTAAPFERASLRPTQKVSVTQKAKGWPKQTARGAGRRGWWGRRGSGPRLPLVLFPVQEQHPEEELIKTKQDEVNAAWQRLKGLALQRQGKLFGAAEVQRFNRYHAGGRSGDRASTGRSRIRPVRTGRGGGSRSRLGRPGPWCRSSRRSYLWVTWCPYSVGTWMRLSAGLRKRSS